jgi:hypothetical protein
MQIHIIVGFGAWGMMQSSGIRSVSLSNLPLHGDISEDLKVRRTFSFSDYLFTKTADRARMPSPLPFGLR